MDSSTSAINGIIAPLSTVFRRHEEPGLHRFADLPEEIRFEIWKLALAEAHIPAIIWRYHRSDQPYRFFGHIESNQVSNIALSCSEARRVMQQCFTPVHLHKRSYTDSNLSSLAQGAVEWVSGNLSPWFSCPRTNVPALAGLPVDLTSSYFVIHFNNMDMLYYIDSNSRADRIEAPASEYLEDRVPTEVSSQIRVLWFHFYHFQFISQGIGRLLERCPNLQRLELTKFDLEGENNHVLHKLRDSMPGWGIRYYHEPGFPTPIFECTKEGRRVYITSILWKIGSDEEESGSLERFALS